MTTTLETFTGTDASLWDLAVDAEPTACASRYYGHPLASGALLCCVNHDETGETCHGATLGPHFFAWTEAQAATSLPGRECLGCQRVIKGEDFYGYCSPSCRTADRYAADEYETEVAA